MSTRKRSIQRIIEEQVKRWQIMNAEKKTEETGITVVTLSREPGSRGRLVAEGLSEKLDFNLFHQEVIHRMAESAQTSQMVLETLDEKGLSVLEDLISSIVYDRHLWPDEYQRHLMRVIGAIGKHGSAVIVGRGANFILSPEKTIRTRIVAPMKMRVETVAREFGCSEKMAERRVIRTESDRRAFIRKYFYADISDPVNSDLVVNTEVLGIDASVNTIISSMGTN